MRNPLWLALLAVSISCTTGTVSSTSLDYLRCPNGAVGVGQPDTGASSSDSSIFGSASTENVNNCTTNPSICGSLGINFECNKTMGCCVEAMLDRCTKPADCTKADNAVCDLTTNHCVQCSIASDKTIGDKQCKEWAATQVNKMGQILCSAGSCVECRENPDCVAISTTKTVCDPVDHTCKGCTKDSDCASQICKLDANLLKSGETNLGQCVPTSDVALVDNAAGNCDNSGAGGKPYCQIVQAVATNKTYIKVTGNGSMMAALYQTVTVSGNGKQVIIIGPGRDTALAQQAWINGVMVTNSAQLTLIGVSVTNNTQPAIQCSVNASLNVQSVLISDAVVVPKGGIYVNSCGKVIVEKTKIHAANGYGVFVTNGTDNRIVNNAFINGGSAGEPSGLKLSGSAAGLFAFNTIASYRQGVQCDTNASITDSIVVANTDPTQINGCQPARVVTDKDTVELNPFYTAGADPTLTANQKNTTSCVDKGLPDTGKTIKDDYLSIKRPLGLNYDIGAFEAR